MGTRDTWEKLLLFLLLPGRTPNFRQMRSEEKSWKQRLFTIAMVIAGSIAIFFPAWLPESPVLPTEDGVVELLQLALLLTGGAFWFGAARTAGAVGPFYQIMGAIALASAIGESDGMIESTTGIKVEFFYIPLGLFVIGKFYRSRQHFSEFFLEFTSHPAAGFFASAFMMIYVLARFLGAPFLWKATLGSNYHPDIPKTVEGYLELLSCYLLLVGTIGLCLAPRSHDPTFLD